MRTMINRSRICNAAYHNNRRVVVGGEVETGRTHAV